jgi:hypothetical protein
MNKLLLILFIIMGLSGCATNIPTVPENMQGVFCTHVSTLTTTVTTVFANKDLGQVTASPECAIKIKTE